MNVPTLPPTPANTLVALLGASEWPYSPAFASSKAFSNAAKQFTAYLLRPQFFGLPSENLLDLFNSSANASEQLEQMSLFLERRAASMRASQQSVRDVMVYFIGHGGFVGHDSDFYLVHRRTNVDSLRASGISIAALADILLDKARHARRYLILDCCFAAAAFQSFQGGPDQVALTKTLDAFHVPTKRSGFPRKGTVLLCSSDQKTPSLLLPDESSTMFSRALLEALMQGDAQRSRYLSLRDVKELALDWLSTLPDRNAPHPALLSPDQSEGDVADIPFFPNPRAEQERQWRAEGERRRQAEEQARKEEEERQRRATSQTPPVSQPAPALSKPVLKVTPSAGAQKQTLQVSPTNRLKPGLMYGVISGVLSALTLILITSIAQQAQYNTSANFRLWANLAAVSTLVILSIVAGLLPSRASGSVTSAIIAGGILGLFGPLLFGLVWTVISGGGNLFSNIAISFGVIGIPSFIISILSGLVGRRLHKRSQASL